jgi:hypothetical protein
MDKRIIIWIRAILLIGYLLQVVLKSELNDINRVQIESNFCTIGCELITKKQNDNTINTPSMNIKFDLWSIYYKIGTYFMEH